jgi:hypothetical protein
VCDTVLKGSSNQLISQLEATFSYSQKVSVGCVRMSIKVRSAYLISAMKLLISVSYKSGRNVNAYFGALIVS